MLINDRKRNICKKSEDGRQKLKCKLLIAKSKLQNEKEYLYYSIAESNSI
jgi:hypothetical protein